MSLKRIWKLGILLVALAPVPANAKWTTTESSQSCFMTVTFVGAQGGSTLSFLRDYSPNAFLKRNIEMVLTEPQWSEDDGGRIDRSIVIQAEDIQFRAKGLWSGDSLLIGVDSEHIGIIFNHKTFAVLSGVFVISKFEISISAKVAYERFRACMSRHERS